MLQQEEPDDYVLGTGEAHSVQEFLEEAFGYLKLNWKEYVELDSKYFRPTEVGDIKADSTKARKKLSWSPKIPFKELVRITVDYDLDLIGLSSPGERKRIIQQKGLKWNINQR